MLFENVNVSLFSHFDDCYMFKYTFWPFLKHTFLWSMVSNVYLSDLRKNLNKIR